MTQLPDFLTTAGSDALRLFWWPLLLWTSLALVVLAVLRLLPHRLAREQYEMRTALLASLPLGVVLAVLFKLLSARALFTVPLPYELVVYANGPASGSGSALVPLPGIPYGALILALGVAVVAVLGVLRFVLDARALRGLSTSLRAVTDPVALDILDQARRRHGIRREVLLATSDRITSPVAFGVLRPTVVIPSHLVDRPDDLRLVLLHETAHLASGDFTLDAVARLVTDLFGWHPLVVHIARTRNYWREAACDLAVIETPSVDRAAYARLLLSVASSEHPATGGLIASMTATPSQLSKRIEAMKTIHTPILERPYFRRFAVAALFLAAVSFTACSDSSPGAVETTETDVSARTDDGSVLGADPSAEVYTDVDKMPAPVGGMAAIGSAVKYPETARQAGVEGRVIISFVVDPDGSVHDASVVKGVDQEIDAEALRVVTESRWEAGTLDGKAVPVRLALPVTFKLR